MERKQLKQFIFYDFYAELMEVLNNEERGKLLRRMCEYCLQLCRRGRNLRF